MWLDRRLVAVGMAVAIQACGTSLSGPGESTAVAELHGREIGLAAAIAPIRWSKTGDRFTFDSPDLRTAFEYEIASGVTRKLFSIRELFIQDVQLSADGQDFYTRSYEGGESGGVIRRHSAAGITVLSDSARSGTLLEYQAREGEPLLVAPNDAAAAFLIEPYDRLVFARRGEEPRMIGRGCGGLIAFSPEGSRVLCRDTTGYGAGLVTMDLQTGAVQPLALPADVASSARAVYWDAAGLRVFHGGYIASPLSLYDQAAGSSRPLLPVFGLYPESGPNGVSLSADGRRMAYWTSYCAQVATVLGGCLVQQEFLYLLDVPTGTSRRVAAHTGGSMNAAISPSGTTMAYAVDGHLYLLDLK